MTDPATFFGRNGPLARVLPGYEERPAQRRLAQAVAETLDAGGLLLAEAGTGTGKTLAYLLPAVELGRRVVISTGTKNLQEQLVQKDIPILARALGRELSVAVMKGRANYLCLLRFSSFAKAGSFRRLEEIPVYRAVEAWAPETQTGDRAEVADMPDAVDFWREISAASENCIGQSCSLFESCFVTRMRQRALEADLVVVNHHLLCADLAVKDGSYGQVIPAYDTLVLDEAHLIEDVATQYFGVHVSSYRVEELARDVERELKAAKLDARDVRAEVEGLRVRGDRLFGLLSRGRAGRLGPGWMSTRAAEESLGLLQRLEGLRTALLAVPDRPEALAGLAGRALALAGELAFLIRAEADDHVYFVETRGRGVYLRAMPIDVSERLKSLLFDEVRAAVLTSATLAVDGGFTYVKERLGLRPTDELLLASPFRYEEQAVLYVPAAMPEPQSAEFVDRAAEEVVRLLELSRGRAFVLFTSYANMNAVAERIAGRLDYPLLIQGEAPKAQLLDTFRETPHAVLLATASFWQGVDVAGEQLSCVIIDKLPFASPGDPVVAARIERLRNNGQNAFGEYQVPVAVLMLKQGLGRLIRTATDRGILAVLDSRLLRKAYGRRFLESLPPARLVHDLDAVARFMA
ncbi:MAG TPA: helicase C-terminal domain-containing protein [Vicinamibacteria bacterium]|nr:helicase C-terminal domain-containing protein [Vicinamibacteria bacterium]